MIPGIKPARNRSAMEVFVATPYMTSGIDGGMMMPIVPVKEARHAE